MEIHGMSNQVNKNSWFWMAPEYFSRWRVFPRGFILVYFWLIIQTAMWFMAIPVPSPAQAAFASAIIGAGAAWFGLYVNSGPSTSTTLSPQQRNAVEVNSAVASMSPEPTQETTPPSDYRPRVISSAEQPVSNEVSEQPLTYRAEG